MDPIFAIAALITLVLALALLGTAESPRRDAKRRNKK